MADFSSLVERNGLGLTRKRELAGLLLDLRMH
jgi:hypothetical protein